MADIDLPDELWAAEQRATQIASYAALHCATCGHLSAHHSDIGTCEACDCLTFEEADCG